MRTKVYLVCGLMILLAVGSGMKSIAQQKLAANKYIIQPKAMVVMRDLPPPVLKTGKDDFQVPDNDEGDEKRAPRKNKPAQLAPSFPVVQVNVQPANAEGLLINETPCVNYSGIRQFNDVISRANTTIPPDVSAAVGFDHLFMALNNRFRIQTKDGDILRDEDQQLSNGFWSAVDTGALFDPKIIYDPYNNRWVYIIDSRPNSPLSALYVAVSHSADPMGGWSIYSIDADPENDQWADFPSVGFNKNWIVINVNMGRNPGSTASSVSRTFVLNKQQLYSLGTVDMSVFDAPNTLYRYWTICPAMVYDPNYNDVWCVTNDDADDNDLRFFKVTGGPSNPAMSEEGFISIGTAWPQNAGNLGPQSGSAARIDLGFDWVQSAVWRNGLLYFSQSFALPSGSTPNTATIQIASCNPVTNTVVEAFRYNTDQNTMYSYANLTVNESGDWIISSAKLTTTSFPSAAVSVRRNGTNTFTETIFKAGEDWYNLPASDGRNRWGDYTTAAIDPSDDNSVWVAAPYSRLRSNPNNTNGEWGTWWAKICSGNCPLTTVVNTIQQPGTMKKFEASFSVIGVNEIRPGADIKFDAGTRIVLQNGFKAVAGSRVRMFIEGCGGIE